MPVLRASGGSVSALVAMRAKKREFPGAAGLPTVMTAPPATAMSAANAASTIATPVTYPPDLPGAFRYYGIKPTLDVNGAYRADVSYDGNTSAPPWAAECVIDSVLGAFEIYLRGSGQKGRVWINGQLVTSGATFTTVGDGNFYRFKVDMAAAGVYRVRIELDGSQRFYGVTVGPTDSVAAPGKVGPRWVLLGCSVFEPTIVDSGPSFSWQGIPGIVSYLTGWDVWAAGKGGTGILNPGAFVKYRDRLANVIATANQDGQLAGMIVAGGLNDQAYGGYSYANMYAESMLLFAQIRTVLPDSQALIALSPWWRNDYTTMVPNILDANDSLKQAAKDSGVIFLNLLEQPIDNPGAGAFAASYGAGQSNISSSVSVPGGQYYVRLGAGAVSELRKVNSVSGSGPYTLSLATATTYAHAAGEQIRQVGPPIYTGLGKQGTPTGTGTSDRYTGSDGTHPTVAGSHYDARMMFQALTGIAA